MTQGPSLLDRPWPADAARPFRLMILAALIALLTLTPGAVAVLGLRDSLASIERDALVVAPALEANRDLATTMTAARSALRGDLLAHLAKHPGTAGDAYVEAERGTRDANTQAQSAAELDRVDALLSRPEYPADSGVRLELDALRRRQRDAVAGWWALARSGPPRSAEVAVADDPFFDAFAAVNADLDRRIGAEQDGLRRAAADTLNDAEQHVMLATGAALVGVALVVAWSSRTVGRRSERASARGERAEGGTAWQDVRCAPPDAGEPERRAAEIVELAQTCREVSRRIQDAGDVEAAFALAVEGVGRALAAESTMCLVTQLGEDRGTTATWSAERGVFVTQADEAVVSALHDDVRRLWDGDRCLLVDDLASSSVELPLPPEHQRQQGAVIVVAFGTGAAARGVISAGAATPCPQWSAAHAGFVESVAADLGRVVEEAEVGRTRAEQVDQQAELDREKESFLATVTHELRTPLTSINGYLELLGEGAAGELTATQRDMLAVVERNAVRLRGLVEDLLLVNSAGAPTSSRPGRDDGACDVDEVVARVLTELEPTATARGVRLELTSASGANVRADRADLARALTNVVANAVKFSARGDRVRVRTLRTVGGTMARIECADEGMGIPMAEQGRVFTRFFRASNATRAQVPGAGLGLVVAKEIVTGLGGRVRLSSAEGVGTTVLMELPVATDAGRSPGPPAQACPAGGSGASGG